MDADEIAKLAALEDTNWWYKERRHLVRQGCRGLTPTTALDIGAAAGGNTRVLERAGWKATALEYEDSGVELARGRGLTVKQGDACDIPFEDDTFGLVIAYDVLEHIEDDQTAVAEIARVVRPGGKVLIAVPADPKLWSAHDVAVRHVRRYTRPGLVALFDNPAFTIDRVRSWNVLLRPVVAMRRRSSTGSDLEEMARPVNAALTAIIRLERVLPLGRLPGVSLLLEATVN